MFLVSTSAGRLSGVVEVDEAIIGGKTKSCHGVKDKCGQGTGMPLALVAAARNGQAGAVLIPNAQGCTKVHEETLMEGWIDPNSVLITDKNSSYRKIGVSFASHVSVQHNKREYANRKTGARINTVEAVNAVVQRALIGVYHRLGQKHLQRYLDEILWRWNHRVPEMKVRKRKSSSGPRSTETKTLWKPIPVVDQMRGLLCDAVGREVRRTLHGGSAGRSPYLKRRSASLIGRVGQAPLSCILGSMSLIRVTLLFAVWSLERRCTHSSDRQWRALL